MRGFQMRYGLPRAVRSTNAISAMGHKLQQNQAKTIDYMCMNLILEHSLDETVLDKICKGHNWWRNPTERNSDY